MECPQCGEKFGADNPHCPECEPEAELDAIPGLWEEIKRAEAAVARGEVVRWEDIKDELDPPATEEIPIYCIEQSYELDGEWIISDVYQPTANKQELKEVMAWHRRYNLAGLHYRIAEVSQNPTPDPTTEYLECDTCSEQLKIRDIGQGLERYCPNCTPEPTPEAPTTEYEVPVETYVEEVKKLNYEGTQPHFQVITDLANEMYVTGLEHGTTRVIAYLKGRLGDDTLIAELEAHFGVRGAE
jgi:hypothetical protein